MKTIKNVIFGIRAWWRTKFMLSKIEEAVSGNDLAETKMRITEAFLNSFGLTIFDGKSLDDVALTDAQQGWRESAELYGYVVKLKV